MRHTNELAIGNSKLYSHWKHFIRLRNKQGGVDLISLPSGSHGTLRWNNNLQGMSLVVLFLAGLFRGLLLSLCLVQRGEHCRRIGFHESCCGFARVAKERGGKKGKVRHWSGWSDWYEQDWRRWGQTASDPVDWLTFVVRVDCERCDGDERVHDHSAPGELLPVQLPVKVRQDWGQRVRMQHLRVGHALVDHLIALRSDRWYIAFRWQTRDHSQKLGGVIHLAWYSAKTGRFSGGSSRRAQHSDIRSG